METGEEGYLLNYWIILLGREQEGHVHYKKKKKALQLLPSFTVFLYPRICFCVSGDKQQCLAYVSIVLCKLQGNLASSFLHDIAGFLEVVGNECISEELIDERYLIDYRNEWQCPLGLQVHIDVFNIQLS